MAVAASRIAVLGILFVLVMVTVELRAETQFPPAGLAVDASGNVTITGTWYNPNNSPPNIAVIKYDTNGKTLWKKRYDSGTGGDYVSGMAMDSLGNAYLTGACEGADGMTDFLTLKFDKNGKLLWARRLDGPAKGQDYGAGIALDSAGNAYVTGDNQMNASGTKVDFTTVKYDKKGNKQWVRRYAGPFGGVNQPVGIAVDKNGNAYVTGSSLASKDKETFDYATVKYATGGKQLWVKRYGSPSNGFDFPWGIAVDGTGSPYISGTSHGSDWLSSTFTTIKYEANGKRAWVKTFGDPKKFGAGGPIAVDSKGNACVTGAVEDTFATVKYGKSGAQAWSRIYNGPGMGSDRPTGLALDASGNVHVTGTSYGVGDKTEIATIKYGKDGKRAWAARFNGKGQSSNTAGAVALDGSGCVYITGSSQLSVEGDFGFATVKYDPDGNQQWVRYYDGK